MLVDGNNQIRYRVHPRLSAEKIDYNVMTNNIIIKKSGNYKYTFNLTVDYVRISGGSISRLVNKEASHGRRALFVSEITLSITNNSNISICKEVVFTADGPNNKMY